MIKRLKRINRENLILLTVFIILIAIPSLFWGNLYQVGGDDTRLYYMFPKEFLQNFVFNVISNNSLGVNSAYTSVAFFAPIIFIILILKQIVFLNVQSLAYGLNLGFGFLSFYLLLGLWVKNNRKTDFYIRFVSAFFYIFSVFVIKTLYSYQLLSIYLITAVPITIYFFIRSVKERRILFVFLSSLSFSVLSSTINSSPWLIALFISIFPLLIFLFLENKKTFISYSFIFLIITFALNIYWLTPFLVQHFVKLGGNDLIGFVNSEALKTSNRDLILALANLNTPLNQFFSYVRTSWGELNIFNMGYVPNIVFILLIIAGGLLIKNIDRAVKKVYVVFLLDLILTFFLFTPNLGNWSINLFILLNEKMPFFAAVRTMYDKFSFAMAFNYALVFGISLKIVFESMKNSKMKYLVILIIFFIIVFNARNFIFPAYNDDKFSTRISGFNKDYYDLTDYIKRLDASSHFLWLPLTKPNYTVIEDNNLPSHYYWGPSPLQIVANVSDYAGQYGFSSTYNLRLNNLILLAIKDGKYSMAADYLKILNVKYIIINNNLTKDIPNNGYLFDKKIYENEMGGLKNEIIGKKIKDFGKRYSLYSINEKYRSEKLFLTTNINDLSNIEKINYKKIHSYEYEIQVNNLAGNKYLVFLDPYSKGWQLFFPGNSSALPLENMPSYKYGNSWLLSTDYIKSHYASSGYHLNPDGSIDISLKLYFYPENYSFLAYFISGLSVVLILIFITLILIKESKFAKK